MGGVDNGRGFEDISKNPEYSYMRLNPPWDASFRQLNSNHLDNVDDQDVMMRSDWDT